VKRREGVNRREGVKRRAWCEEESGV